MLITQLWLSGFLLGLSASLHCFAMCGGLSAIFALNGAHIGFRKQIFLAFLYNFGRISSYMLMGAVIGFSTFAIQSFFQNQTEEKIHSTQSMQKEHLDDQLISQTKQHTHEKTHNQLQTNDSNHQIIHKKHGSQSSVKKWMVKSFRVLSILLVIAVALKLLGHELAIYRGVENMGRKVWKHISPLTKIFYPLDNIKNCYMAGILWGFLPCGMVYAAVASALASVNTEQSIGLFYQPILFMFAFGIGTFPSMLSNSLFAKTLNQFLEKIYIRYITSGVLFAYALWMISLFF